VSDLNISFTYYLSHLGCEVNVDRKFASQFNELYARLTKIGLERSAAAGDDRRLDAETLGVPGDVQGLHFGPAAIYRVENIK
jgi:hypothetical protein